MIRGEQYKIFFLKKHVLDEFLTEEKNSQYLKYTVVMALLYISVIW